MFLSNQIITYITIALGLWLAVITFLAWQAMRHYRRLTKDITKKDLKSLLEKILKDTKANKKQAEEILDQITALESQAAHHLQKLAVVRFNPFSETGGNQSFVVALLNNQDTGLIISSLHSRQATRLYTKQIKKGKVVGGGELSKEEKQALKKAQKS